MVKSSAYCFFVKTKISTDFQICISVPLILQVMFCIKWVNIRKVMKSSFHVFAKIAVCCLPQLSRFFFCLSHLLCVVSIESENTLWVHLYCCCNDYATVLLLRWQLLVRYKLLVIVVVPMKKLNWCLSAIRCRMEQVYLEALFYNMMQNFDGT